MPDQSASGPELAQASTNQVSVIRIVCRSVDMSSAKPEANPQIISTLVRELTLRTNWFDATGTHVVGDMIPEEATHTFQVSLLLTLKHPLKL